MTGSQVIRATQMFTKHGQASKISVGREIFMGFTLGLGFGLVWKVRQHAKVPLEAALKVVHDSGVIDFVARTALG
jgi:hypothetical protein